MALGKYQRFSEAIVVAEEYAEEFPNETWHVIQFRLGFEVVQSSWFESKTFHATGQPESWYNTKDKQVNWSNRTITRIKQCLEGRKQTA